MPDSNLQLMDCDRLRVGFRGRSPELMAAINLCRQFDGMVLFREKDVIIVEVRAYPEGITDLLAKLDKRGVTHVWRSGAARISSTACAAPILKTNFCGINQ